MTNAILTGLPPSERKNIRIDHVALVDGGRPNDGVQRAHDDQGHQFRATICAVQQGSVIER